MKFFSKHHCPKCNANIPLDVWLHPVYSCKECGALVRIKLSHAMPIIVAVCSAFLFALSEQILPAVLTVIIAIILVKHVELEVVYDSQEQSK